MPNMIIDDAARQRSEAITYAIDKLRRAAGALEASAYGEPDRLRAAVVHRIRRDAVKLLHELTGLSRA